MSSNQETALAVLLLKEKLQPIEELPTPWLSLLNLLRQAVRLRHLALLRATSQYLLQQAGSCQRSVSRMLKQGHTLTTQLIKSEFHGGAFIFPLSPPCWDYSTAKDTFGLTGLFTVREMDALTRHILSGRKEVSKTELILMVLRSAGIWDGEDTTGAMLIWLTSLRRYPAALLGSLQYNADRSQKLNCQDRAHTLQDLLAPHPSAPPHIKATLHRQINKALSLGRSNKHLHTSITILEEKVNFNGATGF